MRENQTQSRQVAAVRRTRGRRERLRTSNLVSESENFEMQCRPRADERTAREEWRNDKGHHRSKVTRRRR